MPNVKYLCVNDSKGELKKPVESARLRTDYGIEHDAHAGEGRRQVSLLADEDIQALGQADIRPGVFAENIVLSGLDFSGLGVGSRLKLGEHVVLSLTQIGKQLHSSGNVVRVSGDYIMARAGVYARVEQGGDVRVGDEVELLDAVPRETIQAVVLTISDRCSRGETVDTAGPAVVQQLEKVLQARIQHTEIIPDDKQTIVEKLKYYCDEYSIDLLLTVGGTGPAPRDITPEATRLVVERPTPGFDEAMRYASLAKIPTAILSRGASGIRGTTFIINLPGSERAAVDNLGVILPALPHGVKKLRGHPADCDCCQPRAASGKIAARAG